jgi:hypothetical protein
LHWEELLTALDNTFKLLPIPQKEKTEHFARMLGKQRKQQLVDLYNNHCQLLRHENEGPELYCFAQNT